MRDFEMNRNPLTAISIAWNLKYARMCAVAFDTFFLHRFDSRADKRTNLLTEARVQRGSAVLEYSKAFLVLHTFFLPHFFLTQYSSCERQCVACMTVNKFRVWERNALIDSVKCKYESIFITFEQSSAELALGRFSKFWDARESATHPKSWS